VAFRIDDLQHAGGLSDPVASLLTCAPAQTWLSIINGQVIVENGKIPGLDLDALVDRHNELSRQLLVKAGVAETKN
jgi:8-oxoguanine deaminase